MTKPKAAVSRDTSNREIVITRVVDAPRVTVFPSAAKRERILGTYRADEGGDQTLDGLDEYLAEASRASRKSV